MPEIVGTAYVRIRAITTQLANDIRDGMDQGASDAEAEFGEAGERAGAQFGEGATDTIKDSTSRGAEEAGRDAGTLWGEEFVDSSGKTLRRRIPDEMGDLGDEAGDEFGVNVVKSSSRQLDIGIPGAVGGAVSKARIENDKEAEDTGNGLGAAFSRGFRNHMKKNPPGKQLANIFKAIKFPKFAWYAILGAPAAAGAIRLIGALVAGLTAQLGFLLTAAVGAGAAFAGAFAGVGLAVVPLLLAFKTETKALELFKEEMKDLGEEWSVLGAAAQEGLLPALDEAANVLTDALLPAMEDYSKAIGIVAGDTALMAAKSLSAKENQDELATVLAGSEAIFEDLGRVVVALFDALLPFLADTIPMATTLSELFARWAERFADFIQKSHESGELSETLQTWWDRARLVGGVLKNLFDVLWNIFTIGGDAAQPFFDTLSKTVDKWERFTSSAKGENRIKKIFDDARPVVKAVSGLLGDVVALIAAPALEGDTSGVLNFVNMLRDDIVPALETMADTLATSGVGDKMIDLAGAIADFITETSESGTLATTLEVVTDALKILTDLMSTPGIGPAVLAIAGVATGLSAINTALLGFPAGLARGFGTFFGELIAQFVYAQILVPIGTALAGMFSGLTISMLPLIGIILGIVAVVAGIIWAFQNWDKIKEFAEKAWKAIVEFVTMIGEWLGELPGKILGWITGAAEALWGWLVEAVPKAVEAVGEFIAGIGEALAGIATKVWNWVKGAAEKLAGWIMDGLRFMRDNFGKILGFVASWTIGFPIRLYMWMQKAIPAIVSWANEAIPKVIAAIGRFVSGIYNAVSAFIGELPGRISGAIQAIIGWITTAIPQAATALANWVSGIWTSISTFISELPGKIAGAVTALLGWIGDAASQVAGELAEVASNVWTWITEFVTGLPGRFMDGLEALVDVGAAIISNILTGLGNAIGDIWNWIKEQAGNFLDTFLSELGFGSPSKPLMNIGEGLMESMEMGLDRGVGKATRRAAIAARSVVNAMQGSGRFGGTLGVAGASGGINLVVTIGERDITDIVDSRVSRSNMNMARAIRVRR